MHLIKTKHLQLGGSFSLCVWGDCVCVCVCVTCNSFGKQLLLILSVCLQHTACTILLRIAIFTIACLAVALKCCLSRQLTVFFFGMELMFVLAVLHLTHSQLHGSCSIFESQNTARTTNKWHEKCVSVWFHRIAIMFFSSFFSRLIGVLCRGVEKCCHMEADPTHKARLMTPSPAV